MNQSSIDSSFALLNLNRNASADEIRQAYHRLALIYHPDKVQGEENKLHAQRNFQQITHAYEEALRFTELRKTTSTSFPHPSFFNQHEVYMSHPEKGVFIFVRTHTPEQQNFSYNHSEIFFFPKIVIEEETHSPFNQEYDCQECEPCTNKKQCTVMQKSNASASSSIFQPLFSFLNNIRNMCIHWP